MSQDNLNNGPVETGQANPNPAPVQNRMAPPRRDQEAGPDEYAKIDQILAKASGAKDPVAPGGNQAPGSAAAGKPSQEPGKPADEPFRPESIFEDDELYQAENEGKQKPSKGAKSVADFAAELELDPEDILGLVVGGEDGAEPMPLKKALERLEEVKNFETRRDEFEDYQHKANQELFQAREQMGMMIDRIKALVPPETMARVFSDTLQERDDFIKQNRTKMLELVPEWRDPTTRESELEEMDSFYQKMFGLKPGEIRQVLDARLLHIARFTHKLVQRYERSKQEVKRLTNKVPAQEPSKRVARVTTQQEIKQLAKTDPDAAVDRILGQRR